MQRFKTKSGIEFSGFSAAALPQMHQELRNLGISQLQIAEAASYSMAMVVRYALGLSAAGGCVGAVVGDSLAGSVALATIRHLVNAGGTARILCLGTEASASESLRQQLKPLTAMQVPINWCSEATTGAELTEVLSASHNVICGLFGAPLPISQLAAAANPLNEAQTPVYAVEAPFGIDLDSGTPAPHALFASATLSLGAPYDGLNPANERVGRHYLCDISFTSGIYSAHGEDLSRLFAEQPVSQILPMIVES